MAPRDGLLGAARLALRVALRAIAIAATRRCRRTGLVVRRRFEFTPSSDSYSAAVFKFCKLAPRDGFEPPTNGLTVRRSTTELPGNAEEARIVGKPRTEVKESGVRRWCGTRRALPSSRYNLNFCTSREGELDRVVSHVARPAGHEIIEPFAIVRKQRARGF